MGKWNKTCHSFAKVRSMLGEGIRTAFHCMQIMSAMESCCDELTPNDAEDWVFYDAFRDLKSEIHEEIEFMDETDYESCEDMVNYYLNEMYDLCDSARVWLEI